MARIVAPGLREETSTGLRETAAEEGTLDISFFVPCYNEEDNVAGVIEKLCAISASLGLSYEILVFDDCSKDRTVEIVRSIMAKRPDLPIRLFSNAVNRGVSRNFFEGAFHARGRHYRLVCGDDVEPEVAHEYLLSKIGDANIIVPYYTEIKGRPLHRHVISRLFTFLVNTISGNSMKYYNGCPIYMRYDVLRFHVETTGFGYQAEFLTRLLHEGKTYVEAPLVSIDREGSGSLNFRNFVSVGHSLLKIALRRLRVYLFK